MRRAPAPSRLGSRHGPLVAVLYQCTRAAAARVAVSLSAEAAVAGARRLRGRRNGGRGRSHLLEAATTRKSSSRIGLGRCPDSNRDLACSTAERGGHLAPTRRVRVHAQCLQAAPRWRHLARVQTRAKPAR